MILVFEKVTVSLKSGGYLIEIKENPVEKIENLGKKFKKLDATIKVTP